MNFLTNLTHNYIGKWHNKHNALYEKLADTIKPGDIICRMGSAYIYGYLHISGLMAYLTESKYSHAAMILGVDKADRDILIADVNATGLHRQFLTEWVDEIYGSDIIVLRPVDETWLLPAKMNCMQLIRLNPPYDKLFSANDAGAALYCVELITEAYRISGLELCKPVRLKDLRTWDAGFEWISQKVGIDSNTSIYCVGNSEYGLLSSKELKVVKQVTLKEVL